MTIEAYAKVNFTLEVFGKRPDGYHALRSVVVPISLADTLDVELTDDGSITSDTGYADDLCVKAARALLNAEGRRTESSSLQSSTFNLQPAIGARIRVAKRIPAGGGLGGGSADAAATLRVLNELWHLGKTPEELAEIGAAVGSDVPALVLAHHYRCPVLMEGRGEKVSLLSNSNSNSGFSHLVLANPGVPVSTAEVYRLCTPRTEPAVGTVNDLQAPAMRLCPAIAKALADLKTAGATDVRMSGSGSSVFGFVPDEPTAVRLAAALNAKGLKSWSVTTLTANCQPPTANGQQPTTN